MDQTDRAPNVADLLADDESRGARLRRRTGSIGLELTVFALVTGLFPVLALVALVIDAALWVRRRKPWMALRLLALVWWMLAIELYGLLRLLPLVVSPARRDPERYRPWIYRLLHWWLSSHLAGLRVIFGLEFDVDGLEHAGPGPVVILVRHASSLDTLLPEAFIAPAHGLRLRYVLKRELLRLPTLDIGRRWAPGVFVRRGTGDTVDALDRLRLLTTGLGDEDGIVIYPEGTLYNDQKLARAKRITAKREAAVAPLVARLRHVLPPRPAGTLALLRSAAHADVVICGHVGLARFEYLSDIWQGELVGSTVRMKIWRHAASDVPVGDEEAFAEWLYERWFELDDWIEAQLAGAGTRAAATAAA